MTAFLSMGDRLEDAVNTSVFPQSSYVPHNDPVTGRARTSPPLNPLPAQTANLSTANVLGPKNAPVAIVPPPTDNLASRAAADGGASGLKMAPLGRTGFGDAVPRNTMLGR